MVVGVPVPVPPMGGAEVEVARGGGDRDGRSISWGINNDENDTAKGL